MYRYKCTHAHKYVCEHENVYIHSCVFMCACMHVLYEDIYEDQRKWSSYIMNISYSTVAAAAVRKEFYVCTAQTPLEAMKSCGSCGCPHAHTEPPRVFTWIHHGNLRSSVFSCKAVFIDEAVSLVQPDDTGHPADSTAPAQTQTVFLDVHFISQCKQEVSLYPPSIWNPSE